MRGTEGDAATDEGQQGAEQSCYSARGVGSCTDALGEEQAAEALEQLLETALAPKTDPAI